MGFVQRLLLKAVLRVVHFPKTTLAIAAIALAGAIVFSLTRLSINTDQDNLLNPSAKFFLDYKEWDSKFPENDAIYIVIESADPNARPPIKRWTGLADELTARLSALRDYVKSVDCKVPIDALGSQGILFDDPGDLPRQYAGFPGLASLVNPSPVNVIGGIIHRGDSTLDRFMAGISTQQMVGLWGREATPLVGLVADSWNQTVHAPFGKKLEIGQEIPDLGELAASPKELGYYYVPDESDPNKDAHPDQARHLMLVRVYDIEKNTSLTDVSDVVDAIRKETQNIAGHYPEFKVSVTGRPAIDADEMRITDHDSHVAETVAMIVIFIGLVIFLRSLWLALAAEICLGVGIGWTFGWATISRGELNLLSIVFLIALIGIGMDYLIQILTRYRREARRYVRPQAIWMRVFRYAGPPIVTACLGAAGAFFVSIFTDFRGAGDLGIVAGGGLLLCLLAGYTVLPAMLVLWPPKLKPVPVADRYRQPGKPAGAKNLIFPAIWVATLALIGPFAHRTYFNPNLLDLQAPNLSSVQSIQKLQSWSAVVLSKDLQALRAARTAMEGASTVNEKDTDSILTAYDNLDWVKQHAGDLKKIEWTPPADVKADDLPRLADRARALAKSLAGNPKAGEDARVAADALAKFAAAITAPDSDAAGIADRLTRWQGGFIDELKEAVQAMMPEQIDISKLPIELRSHLVSDDGTYALYLYPRKNLWERASLEDFVKQIESRMRNVPPGATLTGLAPEVYHSTRSIEHSFYHATAYALILIFLLVLIDLRNLGQAFVAISVLALGLPMLVGLMGLLGIKWNFANFFALPILIGAGHEYGVFLMHRYKEVVANPRRVWRRWDVSDRALLLCAIVTSSSFGFFYLLGHHRGLMSLGQIMCLGTACIYLAAIIVVRPLLLWRIEKKNLLPAGKPAEVLEETGK